ncbi:MAG: hypothetical protein VX089_03160 [Pseudomonadota bacterium]|nr:hypothetical protein [Pseudomonadota bacterium]
MKFYKYILLFVLQYFSTSMVSISQPLIILEYSSQNIDQEALKNNSINEDFSTHHKVKKNETLSKIIHKYYGNKGLNLTFVQSAILYKNKSAFVRSNPNFLYAQKNLYLPSINEIKELIYKRKNKNKPISNDAQLNKEIYFFGN